jgi:predicted ArsR family transcriptional regulator
MRMGFELTVVSNTPMTPIADAETVAIGFLFQIGYLPKGYDPKTDVESVRQSVPYKLFMNCFMRRPEKLWSIEELGTVLHTSRPTVYRHLNKLKGFDLIEEQAISTFRCAHCEAYEGGDEAEVLKHTEGCSARKTGRKADVLSQSRKGYRVRYGNLGKSWNFVEAHVKVAMEGYRRTVDHLQELVTKDLAARGKRVEAEAAQVRGRAAAAATEAAADEDEAPEVEEVPLAKVKR